jgi:hypothetical protein
MVQTMPKPVIDALTVDDRSLVLASGHYFQIVNMHGVPWDKAYAPQDARRLIDAVQALTIAKVFNHPVAVVRNDPAERTVAVSVSPQDGWQGVLTDTSVAMAQLLPPNDLTGPYALGFVAHQICKAINPLIADARQISFTAAGQPEL